MAEEADRLVTRGVSVRVRRAGTGPPVLFLHGARGWPAWLPLFQRLSQHYALTVPEHPCFGGSDDPPWLRDVADGLTIDLEPALRDALVLELPLSPLCGDDCLGLCPQCGVRLADAPPGHGHEERGPMWAALKDVRVSEPE